MASVCPNCGKKLHFWEIKAECSSCGVSIPNFNWQKRLEEDNVKAEKQFQVFYKTMNRVAYSIWGTKLRIARLVLTFLPAVGFILPWAVFKSSTVNFDLTVYSLFGNKSFIDFVTVFFSDFGIYLENMKFEGFSGPVTLFSAGYIMFLLSAVFIVIAFFMNIIMCKKPKTKSTIVFDVLSVASSVAAVVCFVLSGSAAETAVACNFGDVAVINGSASVSWGYFVSLALLLVATGINIAVAKAPAKTDEILEEERLHRKAVKDEKERLKRIEREKAKAENEKKEAEEQKRILEEAREKLAESKNKRKK